MGAGGDDRGYDNGRGMMDEEWGLDGCKSASPWHDWEQWEKLGSCHT